MQMGVRYELHHEEEEKQDLSRTHKKEPMANISNTIARPIRRSLRETSRPERLMESDDTLTDYERRRRLRVAPLVSVISISSS